MKIVIVGAGKLAHYLIRELEGHHHIVIIDKDPQAALKFADNSVSEVINGDGSSYPVLKEACEDADLIVALTDQDETNMIACQIAEKHLGVRYSIARVNNPKNKEIMEHFGVDYAFSETQILAHLIEQEIDYEGLRIVHHIKNSDHVLIEFTLSEKSDACGKSMAEYKFVHDSRVVVLASEDGETVTPVGTTVMHAGSQIMMVCAQKDIEQIWKEMVR
ncbi:MAG: NAD-binding protein [Clostridiales bacterium]|nr:NAD-binding protein [Clostridiales bacterium]MBR5974802.1 NAD-binding protein [Clostridiales bacterium]